MYLFTILSKYSHPLVSTGIGYKTHPGYPSPGILKYHSRPPGSVFPWIQPTMDRVVLHVFIEKLSMYKWAWAVQTHVFQGSTVLLPIPGK